MSVLNEAAAIAAAGVRLGLISAPQPARQRQRHSLPVHLGDYPAGPDGLRAYNAAYQKALRRSKGLSPRPRVVPVVPDNYPDTPAGFKAYRHDYEKAWRKLRGA